MLLYTSLAMALSRLVKCSSLLAVPLVLRLTEQLALRSTSAQLVSMVSHGGRVVSPARFPKRAIREELTGPKTRLILGCGDAKAQVGGHVHPWAQKGTYNGESPQYRLLMVF
jgi:hypothetical protein